MKKKIITALLTLMLIVTLAACGGTVTAPTRGAWDEHVFTSEYLGLRFVLPLGWSVTSDLDIGMITGIAQTAVVAAGVEIPDNIDMFHDMMAMNQMTGSNVQIIFERVGRGRVPTRQEMIDAVTEQLEEMGGSVTGIPGTTRIGAYDWYSFNTELVMMGSTIHGRQFFNIHEGYVRLIIITAPPEMFGEILTSFIGLNDPIPEPPAVQHDSALFGTWDWDLNDGYTYVFNADGTGSRGFPGEIDTFEWSTEGDDHLIIGSGLMAESWTFTVVGDMLTIDSRQVPGLIFSYIRR